MEQRSQDTFHTNTHTDILARTHIKDFLFNLSSHSTETVEDEVGFSSLLSQINRENPLLTGNVRNPVGCWTGSGLFAACHYYLDVRLT